MGVFSFLRECVTHQLKIQSGPYMCWGLFSKFRSTNFTSSFDYDVQCGPKTLFLHVLPVLDGTLATPVFPPTVQRHFSLIGVPKLSVLDERVCDCMCTCVPCNLTLTLTRLFIFHYKLKTKMLTYIFSYKKINK